LAEADDLAARLSRPGVTMSRTDAFRAAIAAGFEALNGAAESSKTARRR
jgi:hypothetical protein